MLNVELPSHIHLLSNLSITLYSNFYKQHILISASNVQLIKDLTNVESSKLEGAEFVLMNQSTKSECHDHCLLENNIAFIVGNKDLN